MNYLAHVYFSGDDLDVQLGGLLGDFVKGPLPLADLQENIGQSSGISPAILFDARGEQRSHQQLVGIYLHRQLDAFIDAQPEFLACINRLGADYRRVAGIALDVLFDYFLVKNWPGGQDDLSVFCERFYHHCESSSEALPERARSFMARAMQYNLFERYGDLVVVGQVLEQIEQRFSRPTPLATVMPRLVEEENYLLQQFSLLIPKIRSFSEKVRSGFLV